jgi:hypothetical protein
VWGPDRGSLSRPGRLAVNQAAPAEERSAAASAFFVVAYVAISIPVRVLRELAQLASLRLTGLASRGVVAALAAIVLGLLARRRITEASG